MGAVPVIVSGRFRARLQADRLAVLHLVRLVAGALALLVTLGVPALAAAHVAAPIVGWLSITTVAEVARRRHPAAAAWGAAVMLAVDAVVLGATVARTGGSQSPLVGLVYLHVVSVSLLASHRVAVRLAAWHGVVQFGAFVLASSGRAGLRLPAGVTTATAAELAAVHAAGFVLVAAALAVFSAMNEAVVRRSQRQLECLAAVGRATASATAPAEALATGCAALEQALGVPVVASLAIAPAADDVVLLHRPDGPVASAVPGATNVAVVPLDLGDEPAGVLLVVFGTARRRWIASSTISALGQASRIIADAVARTKLQARIEELATRDPLTGLPNRRVFEDTIERELARALRTGEPVSLAVIDVDHFKQVNDVHGHDVGDLVLQHVGAAVSGAVRASDLVARFGGEEFVVLLPGCGPDEALAVTDGIRWCVGIGDSPVPVTASAGVASFPDQADSAASLFRAADAALYRAKESGRDRTVQSPLGVATPPSPRRRLTAPGRVRHRRASGTPR